MSRNYSPISPSSAEDIDEKVRSGLKADGEGFQVVSETEVSQSDHDVPNGEELVEPEIVDSDEEGAVLPGAETPSLTFSNR